MSHSLIITASADVDGKPAGLGGDAAKQRPAVRVSQRNRPRPRAEGIFSGPAAPFKGSLALHLAFENIGEPRTADRKWDHQVWGPGRLAVFSDPAHLDPQTALGPHRLDCGFGAIERHPQVERSAASDIGLKSLIAGIGRRAGHPAI